MVAVLIDASHEIISGRLADRGREDTAEIEKRIARTAEIDAYLSNCIRMLNEQAIADARDALVNIICAKQKHYI